MVWMKCEIPKKYCRARSDDGGCALHTTCEEIIDKCKGEGKNEKGEKNPDCSRIEGKYCKAYVSPASKWRYGRDCPLSDHLTKIDTKKGRYRVGQQKQKKW